MKTRGAREKSARSVSVVTLVFGALLLSILGAEGKHVIRGKATGATPHATASTKPRTEEEDSRWAKAYGKLPLSFEENQGQTVREVRYVSHGNGYELFLTSQEAVLALPTKQHYDLTPRYRTASIRALRKANKAGKIIALRMQLEGANPSAEIAGMERLPTRVNYLIGNDPKKWHTGVPSFARVKYSDVYPGVDLIFYGNQRQLEYDFVVAPGADPQAIRLKVDGAHKMRIDSHGDLVLSVAGGEVKFQKPFIYQTVRGQRRQIGGNYAIDDLHRVTFSVPSYDRNTPLILDPVLNYSTYLGGTSDDSAYAIAVDGSGDAFVAGQTFSTNFPAGTNGAGIPAPTTNNGASFVAELDPTGANLLYSTYLAGLTTPNGDGAFGVAVDSSGKIYVTGITFATDFPTTANAFNAGPLTTNTNGTAYLTKLDPTVNGTSSLLYSTYIANGVAGTAGELANSVAADAAGNAYVVGQTESTSTEFPITTNALQSAPSNSSGTAFLTRIDTTKAGAASLIFSTFFGGNGANASASSLAYGDQIFHVAVDSSQHAYLVGATTSTDSPATFITSATAFETAPPAGNTQSSVFVSNIDTTAGSLVYSTYLAGSTQDLGYAIGLGPNNVAYVTGSTASTDFPIVPNPGAFDTVGAKPTKAFVTLVVADGTKSGAASVPYSTYLGGTGGPAYGNYGYAIKVDASGNAYVAGLTDSPNFPVTPGALQATLLGKNGDAFIAKLNPAGKGTSDLLYASYYGGSGNATNPNPDVALGLAIDSANPPNAYLTGFTYSKDLPVLSALPTGGSLQGSSDAYVAKLGLTPTLTVAPASFDFGIVQLNVPTAPQAFQVTNNTASAVTFNSISITGVSPSGTKDFAISSDGCSPSVAAGAAPCTVSVTFSPSVAAAESATLVINATTTTGGQASTQTFNVSLTGTGSATAPAVTFKPTSVAFGNQAVNTTSAPPTPVVLTNSGLGPLTISLIGTSGDFAATSTGATACPISPATLAAGASCTINVTFTPTAAGARTGTLSVTDNASGSPQTVLLTGTGISSTPGVGLSPTTAALGNQMVTTTSAASPVKLTNTGTGPLTINSIAASGDFAQTNNCPASTATLAASASCTINVTFTPTATGARTGTLTVTDNASGSPHTVSLTGTGWDFQVTAPSAENGRHSVTFNATMTPLGGFNQSVAFTCTSPTGTNCTITSPVTAADGMTPQPVQVTVTRTSMVVPLSPLRLPPLPVGAVTALASALALLLLLPKQKELRGRLGLAAAVVVLVILAGCSSGPGALQGNVTITGMSTGTAGSVSHSTNVAILLQ